MIDRFGNVDDKFRFVKTVDHIVVHVLDFMGRLFFCIFVFMYSSGKDRFFNDFRCVPVIGMPVLRIRDKDKLRLMFSNDGNRFPDRLLAGKQPLSGSVREIRALAPRMSAACAASLFLVSTVPFEDSSAWVKSQMPI